MDTVVGRESELQAVEAFLDRTSPERTALAIVGEPGIGKTTLWTRAVERARERGATVLTSRPAESEAGLSFAGLADLLSIVPAAVFASLASPQRTALDVALLQAPAARPPERRLVTTALPLGAAGAGRRRGGRGRDRRPPLARRPLRGRRSSSRSAASSGSRCARSSRRGPGRRSPRSLAALARERRVVRLELGPLSVASLHRVLLDELGRAFPRPTLVRIAAASGGNPLYALEIARLVDRGRGPDGATCRCPTA